MADRKALSKKIRFEVFKRDSFRCQYCGRSSPDVVLEVDHIVPVAEGGDNDLMNLVTSCRDCNRGKGKNQLSDKAIIERQKAELDELNERREQMEMMIKWRESLSDIKDRQVNTIADLVFRLTGNKPSEEDLNTFHGLLTRFSFDEVYEATEISLRKYYLGVLSAIRSVGDYIYAIDKIGGVCYNRRKQGQVKV